MKILTQNSRRALGSHLDSEAALALGIGRFGNSMELYHAPRAKNIENTKSEKENTNMNKHDQSLAATITEIGEIAAQQIKEMQYKIEDFEKIIGRIGAPPGGGPISDSNSEYARDFVATLKTGRPMASMSTLSDPDGGYASPAEMERNISTIARSTTAMRNIADVRTLERDLELVIAVGGVACDFVTEKGAREETDGPTLSKLLFPFRELYCMPVATNRLLDLAFMDFLSWLSMEAGYAFSAKEEWSFISEDSDGLASPRGLLSYPKILNSSWAWGSIGFVNSGNATTLTADSLLDLQDGLDPQYRANASWLMAGSTWTAIRKMKTGEAEYIWRPGLEEGAPSTLLGRPVYISEQMPSVGAGAYPIAYGDFKRGYIIGDHKKGTIILPDSLTQKGFTKLYCTRRILGGVQNYEAIKLLKISA